MKVPVYNQQAEKTGEVDLSAKIFEVKPQLHLMSESVRVQQSNSRKGLANTKTRGEVRGGGKKPWKQKGTGRARAGSTRSPIWVKGGVALGPRSNRNWELKINKKAKSKALFMSLSDKAANGRIVVVEAISLNPVKTKEFVKVVKNFQEKVDGLGKKYLFVLLKSSPELVRTSRNVPHITSQFANALNIVDVLKADSVIILKESLPVIEKTFLKSVKSDK